MKIGQKIGMFISNFRLRRTPGPWKINDFTNKNIFLLKEAYAQNNKLYIKMPSSAWYDLPICQKFKKTDFGRNLPGAFWGTKQCHRWSEWVSNLKILITEGIFYIES